MANNPFRKQAFFTGALLLLGSFLPLSAHACDPLGCLVIGKDQDLLALVTVTRLEGTEAVAAVEHVVAKNMLLAPTEVRIRLQPTQAWNRFAPQPGEHYFASLACPERSCVVKWGIWQTDSAEAKAARLLRIRSGDDAAIQWLLNGNGSSFYGVGTKMFAKISRGDIEIYPSYPSAKLLQERASASSMTAWVLAGTAAAAGIACLGCTLIAKKKAAGGTH